MTKDVSIHALLARFEAAFGAGSFDVVDHWEADLCAVGVARPGEPGTLAYVSTFGLPDGRYSVRLERPPSPGSDLPYTPAGEREDIGLDEVLAVVGAHLGLTPHRS